jgi:DNA ligase-1
MRYEIVVEAYRDLEGATGRIALIDRLGMAERLAARAVAQAAGVPVERVMAGLRDTGDLGLTAEQLLGELDPDRAATLEIGTVFDGLHEIARAEGEGSQGCKLAGLTDLLGQATPLEARYLVRTVTGSLRLGIGTATILDGLAEVHAGGRKARPVLERAYNICSDLGLVAATGVGVAELSRLARTVRAWEAQI